MIPRALRRDMCMSNSVGLSCILEKENKYKMEKKLASTNTLKNKWYKYNLKKCACLTETVV
jgi:hypothetical protein